MKVTLFFVYLMFASSYAFAELCDDVLGQIRVKPSKLFFGSVEAGSTNTLTLTIKNIDIQPMNVFHIVPQDSSFLITEAPTSPFCMQAGETVTIEVVFAPKLAGQIDSNIRIVSTGGVGLVEVFGTGVNPAGPTVNPGSIDFGTIKQGDTASSEFTLTNNGSSPITINKMNSNNAEFRILSPSFPRTLNPGSSLSVVVVFSPNKTGNFKGTLSIVIGSNTAASVSLSGSVTISTGNADISISPQTLAYGNVDVGTFKTQKMTISNTGEEDLTITLPSDFLLTSIPVGSFSIKPNKSVQVVFKFVADVTGSINRKYTIFSNDPDESKIQFSVTAVKKVYLDSWIEQLSLELLEI